MYVDVTLDDIILYALEHHVSDIHFDPVKSGAHVRLRKDGLLQHYMTVSLKKLNSLSTVLRFVAL